MAKCQKCTVLWVTVGGVEVKVDTIADIVDVENSNELKPENIKTASEKRRVKILVSTVAYEKIVTHGSCIFRSA